MAINPGDAPNQSQYLDPLPKGSYVIRSGFGMRKHPILGTQKMHTGLDMACPEGTPIFAPADGRIGEMGSKGGYGNYTKLIADKGTKDFAFGHQCAFAKGLGPGSHVKKGQIIGYVGKTGQATGNHLHYEVLDKRSGGFVDPAGILASSFAATMDMAAAIARGAVHLAKETAAAADRVGAAVDQGGHSFLKLAARGAGKIPPEPPQEPPQASPPPTAPATKAMPPRPPRDIPPATKATAPSPPPRPPADIPAAAPAALPAALPAARKPQTAQAVREKIARQKQRATSAEAAAPAEEQDPRAGRASDDGEFRKQMYYFLTGHGRPQKWGREEKKAFQRALIEKTGMQIRVDGKPDKETLRAARLWQKNARQKTGLRQGPTPLPTSLDA